MCDLTTMMIASTVVGAAGSMYQASAAANAASAQAKVNEQNAILAKRRAEDAINRGQLEENRKLQEGTLLRKQQEASFAAANIDTGYGSALDVIVASAWGAEQDAAIIRSNAEREAYDYEVQAWNYKNEAAANKASAKGAMIGGLFSTMGTVLDGGASIFKYKASVA